MARLDDIRDTARPGDLLEGQLQHLMMVILMLAGAYALLTPADGRALGLTGRGWALTSIWLAVLHQVVVAAGFRLQLYRGLLTRLFGDRRGLLCLALDGFGGASLPRLGPRRRNELHRIDRDIRFAYQRRRREQQRHRRDVHGDRCCCRHRAGATFRRMSGGVADEVVKPSEQNVAGDVATPVAIAGGEKSAAVPLKGAIRLITCVRARTARAPHRLRYKML